MPPVDPHSFTDSTHPFTTHISLSFYFDFPSSTIHAAALLSLPTPHTGPLSLDTRSLALHKVLDPITLTPLPFTISPPDPIKGGQLTITLTDHSSVLILYSTSPDSSALQWLSPPQTFNKKYPFVYTQCQSIHARSVFPCQDTPAARVCYSAKLNVPGELSAVMSAKHCDRRAPAEADLGGLEFNGVDLKSLWVAEGRAVEEFVMEQPIPPYLFAFAVGELGFREVGPRR